MEIAAFFFQSVLCILLMGPSFSTFLDGMSGRFINTNITNLLSKWFYMVTSFSHPAQRDFLQHAFTLNST
jgi:hypothetical protein